VVYAGYPARSISASDLRPKDVRGLRRGQDVVDVPEVDTGDELLGRHIREQLPQRLALELGVEIPHRVDQRRRGEVDNALLGAEPPQLAVGNEVAPEAGHVGGDPFQGAADHVMRQQIDRLDAQLVPATDGEGQPVAGDALWVVGLEHHVCRRVVGVAVHRVRTVQRPRRRKADVVGDCSENSRAHLARSYMLKLRCLSILGL
jgi:hypothetical protein